MLEDPEVRQGIKEYSDWPTIPQLYVNGEFVGGSDIMIEMYESGELQALIKLRCPTRRGRASAPRARLVVAITGATGSIYGMRLLQRLRAAGVETHLVCPTPACSTCTRNSS